MAEKQMAEQPNLAVLEEAGIAFDPTTQVIDLTKEEKRRTTALFLAINAYEKLIIKDAELYIAVSREREREGPQIQPATINAMVAAAIQFDAFIAGQFSMADLTTSDDAELVGETPNEGIREKSA